MSRILVVCSVHNPDIAAPEELLWLLTRLRPEVLFLEHPVDEVQLLLNESCKTLECLAVRGYLRSYEATVVPVDVSRSSYELPESAMKAAFDEMFAAAEGTSESYRIASQAHAHATATSGFAYLNSSVGWSNEVALRHELARALASSRVDQVTEHFELWSRFHDIREHAFLAGIQHYARQQSFQKAVLVVGSAHRQPLLDKLQREQYRDLAALQWEFSWDLDDGVPNSGPSG